MGHVIPSQLQQLQQEEELQRHKEESLGATPVAGCWVGGRWVSCEQGGGESWRVGRRTWEGVGCPGEGEGNGGRWRNVAASVEGDREKVGGEGGECAVG